MRALCRQWMLPELSVAPHVPLLSQFQQIIELNESGRLLQDLSARNGPNHQYRDLKVLAPTHHLLVSSSPSGMCRLLVDLTCCSLCIHYNK